MHNFFVTSEAEDRLKGSAKANKTRKLFAFCENNIVKKIPKKKPNGTKQKPSNHTKCPSFSTRKKYSSCKKKAVQKKF
jgi:hypothetical protein